MTLRTPASLSRTLLPTSPFFEEAAGVRMPLQTKPTDLGGLEALTAFTEKYGYEFAEAPPGS